ncbi:MAG: carbonic anhydrase [Candidatus Micrarchaeota archaeon]|nr:carbonic anhydrase [Candidatus Micrarchaeota archaeon]
MASYLKKKEGNGMVGKAPEKEQPAQIKKELLNDRRAAIEEAMRKLIEGNGRFVDGKHSNYDIRKRREELVSGQKPFAMVVDCADSRTSPEIVFDAGLGDLFVVRKAGNFVEPGDLGTLEYGAAHLKCPVLVVMGHQSCGAINAACKSDSAEGNISFVVKPLQEAVNAANRNPDAASRENVKVVIKQIREKSPLISRLEKEGALKVVGAYYSLESGKVEFFNA